MTKNYPDVFSSRMASDAPRSPSLSEDSAGGGQLQCGPPHVRRGQGAARFAGVFFLHNTGL